MGEVYCFESPEAMFTAMRFLGFGLAIATTFASGHLELFGLAQIYEYQMSKASFNLPREKDALHPVFLGVVLCLLGHRSVTIDRVLVAIVYLAFLTGAFNPRRRPQLLRRLAELMGNND